MHFRWMLLILGWVWLGLPAVESVWAGEVPVSTQTVVEPLKERLDRIFAGDAPKGLDDLRAMQAHVKTISPQLISATVGVRIGEAWGSGVIISKDGYVLTAAHVAGKPNVAVDFVLNDGRVVNGITLGLNRTLDAGMMKITDQGEYPFAAMGTSENLQEGQWCMALGHPGGYSKQRGIVVRLGRVLLTDTGAITSDCTLVGGDSGGPLFNMQGHVIGINSRIAGALTANLHVPVSTFRETWDRLVKSDSWGHFPGHEPVLGVRGDKDATNAKVATVMKGSPAEKAGLQVGDVILKFADQEIADFRKLVEKVLEHQPNDRVLMRVQRGEQFVEVTVVLGQRGNLE